MRWTGLISLEHRRQLVSAQRLASKFWKDAFKQVVDHGYRAPDVATRLGGLTHSPYMKVRYPSDISWGMQPHQGDPR